MTKSSIGTRLQEIIRRETGVVSCRACKADAARLDRLTADEVREHADLLIGRIASHAANKAPKLWQRIAVKANALLGTGQVEAMIGRWLDEAIAGESE